jgi:hypothetical protein
LLIPAIFSILLPCASNTDTKSSTLSISQSFQVIQEVKSNLSQATCPWLIVFDNVEDPTLVSQYIPSATVDAGTRHIVITSRKMSERLYQQRVILDCWSPEESIQYLVMAAGAHSGVSTQEGRESAKALAMKLGYLPLALAIGAAYMRR